MRSARPNSAQAVRPFSERPLTSAQIAMLRRNSGRCSITNADTFTARIPIGVDAPTTRKAISRTRWEPNRDSCSNDVNRSPGDTGIGDWYADGVRCLARPPADNRIRGWSWSQRSFLEMQVKKFSPAGHSDSRPGFRPDLLVAAAAAGPGRSSVLACVERVSAGARLDRVRIVNSEPGTHETVDVVDLGALDIRRAEVVDQDTNAALVHDLVTRPDVVVEGHPVLQAGATAAADEDAQGQFRVGLFLQQRHELRQGFIGECDSR